MKLRNTFTIHVAGEVEAGRYQACIRCGAALIDYRGQQVMSATGRSVSFWPVGGMIGTDGHGSYLMPDRPLDPDEEQCTAREGAVV